MVSFVKFGPLACRPGGRQDYYEMLNQRRVLQRSTEEGFIQAELPLDYARGTKKEYPIEEM